MITTKKKERERKRREQYIERVVRNDEDKRDLFLRAVENSV